MDLIAQMKQVKMEAMASGNRVIEECDDYMGLMTEAQTQQKTETAKCTTNHETALATALSETKSEAEDLHKRADDVSGNLKACKEIEDVVEGVSCLSKTSDGQIKPLSKITSDSSKLLNKHDRKVKVAQNTLDFCKTDVTYFYGDVMTDIMSLHRECTLYGDKKDYEIPKFESSF